jgi:hypothetical protein
MWPGKMKVGVSIDTLTRLKGEYLALAVDIHLLHNQAISGILS